MAWRELIFAMAAASIVMIVVLIKKRAKEKKELDRIAARLKKKGEDAYRVRQAWKDEAVRKEAFDAILGKHKDQLEKKE